MTTTASGPIAPYFPFPITIPANGMATQQFQNYWKTAIDQAVAAALAAQAAQTSADGAEASAEAAQLSAEGAQTTANDAQTSANAASAAVVAETTRAEAAEALLAPLASPIFTGNPTAPTPLTADNDTSIATTAYVQAQGYVTSGGISGTYAPINSPVLTGDPKAPTPTAGDNDTSIATTAFVTGGIATAISPLALKASPTFTGTVTVPTPTAGDNSTKAASTAFITTALGSYAPLASPALTGVPTAPTATAGTNTTQLATTAFVGAAVTALSLADGQFTPALTNVANVSSSTAYPANYLRVGKTVTVSGRVDLTLTTAGVATGVQFAPPFASAFVRSSDCAGVIGTDFAAGQSGLVEASGTNIYLSLVASATGSRQFYYHFTYRILP